MKRYYIIFTTLICLFLIFCIAPVDAHCDVPATIYLYSGSTPDFDTGIIDCSELTNDAIAIEYTNTVGYTSPVRVNLTDDVEVGRGGKSSWSGTYLGAYPYPSAQSLLNEGMQPFIRYRWSSAERLLYIYKYTYNPLKKPEPDPVPTPTHTHEFIEGTITEPTADTDGVGGIYCATCGYVKETYPISAYAYALYDYGETKIKSSQPGQNVVFEFGEWNSFPKSFMADLAAKSAAGVTFEFHYKWNHESQTIIIPAGVPIDLNEEWYGPAKMRELYLQYSLVQ